MEPKLEVCRDCDSLTGNAGFHDGSLYLDFEGPYCETCYENRILEETDVEIKLRGQG